MCCEHFDNLTIQNEGNITTGADRKRNVVLCLTADYLLCLTYLLMPFCSLGA